MTIAILETQTIIDTLGSSLPVYVRHYRDFVIPRGGADVPHRHDFQEVLWFLGGAGRHRIDDVAVDTEPGSIAVIGRGQVHWFEHADGIEFYRLCFHDEFLQGGGLLGREPLGLFNPARGSEPLQPGALDLRSGRGIFDALTLEYEQASPHPDLAVLRALVVALIRLVERVDRNTPRHVPPAKRSAQAFLDLLERHVGDRHDVAYYADALGVSADRLCQDVQQALGKTTKRLIQERLLLEARRYLIYTGMSIKEIGESLGFSDPQYFGKVFKDALGITPAAYRRATLADLGDGHGPPTDSGHERPVDAAAHD